MCSTPNSDPPRIEPPEVDEPKVELGTAKKPSDIRRRRSTGISSLRTGLSIPTKSTGLSAPGKV